MCAVNKSAVSPDTPRGTIDSLSLDVPQHARIGLTGSKLRPGGSAGSTAPTTADPGSEFRNASSASTQRVATLPGVDQGWSP